MPTDRFSATAESYEERANTGPDGSFRLRILDGTAGELRAEFFVGGAPVAACPQFRTAVCPEAGAPISQSAPVFIDTQYPPSATKLELPVASCQSWPR